MRNALKKILLALAFIAFANAAFAHDVVGLGMTAVNPAAQRIIGATNDTTFTVPAGAYIKHIIIKNSTANAITGGLKFGTTSGGVDVAAAVAVGANAVIAVTDAAILKRFFSTSSATTIYVQDVTAWNSANVSITVELGWF